MKVFLKGVYFLYLDGVIVYVGKSNDIYRRIYEHSSGRAKGEKKQFDRWEYIEFQDEVSMGRFEAICIRAFKPKYNIDFPDIHLFDYEREGGAEPDDAKNLFDYMRSTSVCDLDIALRVPSGTSRQMISDGIIGSQYVVCPRLLGMFTPRVRNDFIVDNYEKLKQIRRKMENE